MQVDELQEELDEVEADDPVAGHFQEVVAESTGVYLCGPIRCVDGNGRDWREDIIDDYPEIDFNNPLDRYDPNEVEILNDPIDYNQDEDVEQIVPSEYVTQDMISICKSDCVFVGLPENIARGSMMECMYAALQGIPVFVWEMDGQQESGWIYHHATFVDDDRERVMDELIDHARN